MDIKETQYRKLTSAFRHPWELARIEIIIRMLKQITKELDASDIYLIDIGCGDLFVLDKISQTFNFHAFFGVDIALSDETIKGLEPRYSDSQITILNNLAEVNINKNKTSIVLLLDVIEHIENDKKFLIDLSRYDFVSENTIFIISVPSFQSMFSSHDEFLVHFRRYSNSSLIKTLIETNHKISFSGYFFTSLLAFRAITVAKEKLFKRKNQRQLEGTDLTTWSYNKSISQLVKYLLLTDYFITNFFLKFKIKIPGLSNYVICKKNG